MADTKISALSAGTAAPGDEIPVNRAGSNFKITAGDILKQDSGTLTADAPALDLTQTWNASGVTFTGLKFNADGSSSTNSASGSLLMDLQVGGTSRFMVDKDGNTTIGAAPYKSLYVREIYSLYGNATISGGVGVGLNGSFRFANNGAITTFDVYLFREGAGIFAQRNSTNAQTFRIYNTYTDASNYERGKLEWSSNVLRIGTEKAGTGTARDLAFETPSGYYTFGKGITSALSPNGTILEFYAGATRKGFIYAQNNALEIGGASVINFSAPLTNFTVADGANIGFATTNGTKIGTATSQKLSFWNATPVVQPTTGITAGTFVANTSGISDDTATFDGYTLGQVVAALRQVGILA